MRKKILFVQTIFLAFLLAYSLTGYGNESSLQKEKPEKNGQKTEEKVPPGFHKRPRKNGHGGGRFGTMGARGPMNRFAGRFTAEDRAELHRLSMTGDRAAFGEKLKFLRKKYATEEDKKVFLLEEKYHAAKTAEEKSLIRKELESAVKKQIEKRNEYTLKQITLAEKKLQKLKEFHAGNVKNADKMASRITDFICTPPAERKKLRPAPRGGKPFPGKKVEK